MSLLPIEQEQALETLTILVDTREHETAEAVRRWSAFGKPWRKEKLDSGDYSAELLLPSGETWRVPCVIERKMNLSEICGNFSILSHRFLRPLLLLFRDISYGSSLSVKIFFVFILLLQNHAFSLLIFDYLI